MGNCEFLSSYEDRVQCFKECPFYKWEENTNACPFGEINVESKEGKSSNLYDVDFHNVEKNYDIRSLYKENYI